MVVPIVQETVLNLLIRNAVQSPVQCMEVGDSGVNGDQATVRELVEAVPSNGLGHVHATNHLQEMVVQIVEEMILNLIVRHATQTDVDFEMR